MSRHRLSQPGPGTPNALEPRLRRVVVLSPHPDDAPLSLGQSLLNGLLSQYPVTVVVLFGRTSGESLGIWCMVNSCPGEDVDE